MQIREVVLISAVEWLNRRYLLVVNIGMGDPQRKRGENSK